MVPRFCLHFIAQEGDDALQVKFPQRHHSTKKSCDERAATIPHSRYRWWRRLKAPRMAE